MGTFSPVALGLVLKRVVDESRSGDLQVVSGNRVKTIRVEKGAIRFAVSNLREDRLGESMLSHDCISSNDYHVASERMTHDGCRFGEALLKMGRLDRKQLHRELGVQVQRIVLSLFRVSDGLYSFEEVTGPSPKLPFSLSVPPLLLKGLRRVTDGRLILEALPAAETLVRIAKHPAYKLDLGKLASVERAVLEKAGTGNSIGSIVRHPSLKRSTALRSCYALMTVGMLEVAPQPVDAVEAEEDRNPPEDPSVRELIDSQFERLEDVPEEDLLGVRRDASTEELRSAYEGLRSEWTELREQTREASLLEKIDAIDFRLASAYHHLVVGSGIESTRRLPEAEPEPQPDTETDPTLADSNAARHNRIEQLERDAKLHLQVKDWNGAISLLHELVSLAPKKASYQLMLGRAMQFQPTLQKDAEAHFLQAIELSPNDAKTHLALGQYYRKTKKHSRAMRAIQRAVELDPTNEEALRLLRGNRQPTKMKRLLNKIFQ